MELLKKELCFLSKNGIHYSNNNDKYQKELIISPFYYWYFERKLPTSSRSRAKKIIPQILSSFLPKKEFEYFLKQKDKNDYEIFVVDLELLKANVAQFGLDFKKISYIAFANNTLNSGFFDLGETTLLIENNHASELKQLVNTTQEKIGIEKALQTIEKINYKISMGNSTYVENTLMFIQSHVKSIAAILILLIASQLIISVSNIKVKNSYLQKEEALLQNQSYAQHRVQLAYIKESFMQTDFEQKAFRSYFESIARLKGNNNTYIQSLEYNQNHWTFDVKSSNKNEAQNFISPLDLTFVKNNNDIYMYEKRP